MKLLCPNCKNILTENDHVYRCSMGHSFDISKEGYVNLIISNAKKTKNPGDNKLMTTARRDFLSRGYYERLSDEINKIVYAEKAINVLDIGASEGYYTYRLDKHLVYPHKIIGIDISKDSIKLASKKQDDCLYIVASTRALPIEDASVDIIINNFAPADESEFLRVLKSGGKIIKITPAPQHLIGLKQKLFENVIIKDNSKKFENFSIIKDYTLEYDITVNKDDIMNLFRMTPFCYKTSPNDINKLLSLESLDTKVSFNITIYKKK